MFPTVCMAASPLSILNLPSNPLVTAVIVTNIVIAAGCWYAVWHLWQLRKTLAGVADALASYERTCYDGLHPSPDAILIAQRGTRSLRQQYRQLELQLEQVQKLLGVLGFGQLLWRQRATLPRPWKRRS